MIDTASPYAHLRDAALAYASTNTVPYSVCLDRNLQMDLLEARNRWVAKKVELDNYDPANDTDRSMADEPASDRLARELDELEAEVEQARQAALPQSIILRFGLLPASEGDLTAWDVLVEMHTADGKVDTEAIAAKLPRMCYLRAEDPEGGNLDLNWAQAAALLDAADMGMLRKMLWGHNHYGAAVPFELLNSGKHAT